MKIAIVDDENIWLQEEKKIIEKYYGGRNVQIDLYQSGKKLLEDGKQYDIILMDIELGEGEEDGFAIAKKYRKIQEDVVLLIMTTHTEFSRKGYYVNAFRYIDKIYMNEELPEALLSADKRIVQDSSIELPIAGIGIKKIKYKNIIYIEARNNYIEIHTNFGILSSQEKIKNVNEKLNNKGFYQVHRAYIVNLEWIEKYSNEVIYIKNGEEILMSRRRYGKFKDVYFKWKMERANG